MLPESMSYEASWVDTAGGGCFQVMQAPDRATLDMWIARWSDLVTFEVVPVLTSTDFWAAVAMTARRLSAISDQTCPHSGQVTLNERVLTGVFQQPALTCVVVSLKICGGWLSR